MRGPQGEPGKDGAPGKPGEPGPPGVPGNVSQQCSLKEPQWNFYYLMNQNLPYRRTILTTNKKLLLVKSLVDIYAAKRVCDGVCGRVFLPVSSEENQQVARFLSTHDVSHAWLRASDSYEEGVWKDFETLEDMKFTNWGSGQPDDYVSEEIRNIDDSLTGENYAVLFNDGYWNDVSNRITWRNYVNYDGAWILCELPNPLK